MLPTTRAFRKRPWSIRGLRPCGRSATDCTRRFPICPRETRPCVTAAFWWGRDAALLVEGFATPAGASFQMDALRMVSQAPVKGALNTHHHLDHSIGNAFYGTRGIEVWAHPAVARRIVDSYTPLQGADRAAALGPFEKRMKDAKSEV